MTYSPSRFGGDGPSWKAAANVPRTGSPPGLGLDPAVDDTLIVPNLGDRNTRATRVYRLPSQIPVSPPWIQPHRCLRDRGQLEHLRTGQNQNRPNPPRALHGIGGRLRRLTHATTQQHPAPHQKQEAAGTVEFDVSVTHGVSASISDQET